MEGHASAGAGSDRGMLSPSWVPPTRGLAPGSPSLGQELTSWFGHRGLGSLGNDERKMRIRLIVTGVLSFFVGALICGLVVGFAMAARRPASSTDTPASACPGFNLGTPFENVPAVLVISPTNDKICRPAGFGLPGCVCGSVQQALDFLLPIPSTLDTQHLAVLLEPGDYKDTELHVGYFTSVSGVGEKPSDVKMGNIKIDTVDSNRHDTTTIFWRSVENMETKMKTWCSQGISFRRILSNSFLHDQPGTHDPDGHGGGSGGFIADSLVRDGYGSNFAAGGQQYFIRNLQASELKNYGTFNTLYLGCRGTYGRQAKEVAYIDKTPAIAEKPYIVKDSRGVWKLVKPKLRYDAHGPTFDHNGDPIEEISNEFISFDDILIADHSTSTATINERIKAGKHVIFTPHAHRLDDSIVIDRSGTVILGLGLASLECASQKPCIIVGAVDDVRIAGIVLVGAPASTNKAWIQIGSADSAYAGDEAKPTILSDVHAIVGYYRNTSVQSSVTINNGHVIVDHSWSWRSDIDGAHGESRNGFTINGDHVKTYGLFAEHHWQYSLAWYGEFGKSYFFQCETPWDAGKGALVDWHQPHGPDNPWRNWPAPNWYTIQPRCYYVHDAVENFFGVSVGAYSMEGGGCSWWCGCSGQGQDKQTMDTHIQIPNKPNVALLRAVCWKNCGGGVEHCINTGRADSNWQVHTSWCNGMEVPYLGADGAYMSSGVITANECADQDVCQGFMKLDKGCHWTEKYNCPDQPPYNKGAGDDGSIGYKCCCTQQLWKQCHSQDCSWTHAYSCPGQAAGTKGSAKDDGSKGYDCCCRQEYWRNMNTTRTLSLI